MTIAGDLDLHSAAFVMDEFSRWTEGSQSNVSLSRIDATRVDFISAAGVTAMLRICRHQATSVEASSVVARLITLCDVGDVLVVVD